MASDFLKQMRAQALAQQKLDATQTDSKSTSKTKAASSEAAGSYYSPDGLLEKMASVRETVTKRQTEYESASAELSSVYAEAEEKGRKINLLEGKLTSPYGLEQLNALKNDYNTTVQKVNELQSSVQSAYGSYKQSYDEMSSLQSQYESWKGTVRRGLTTNEVQNLNREKSALEKINKQLRSDMASVSAFGSGSSVFQQQIEKNQSRIREIDSRLSNTPQADAEKAQTQVQELTSLIEGLSKVNRQLERDSASVRVLGQENPIQSQIETNRRRIQELEQELTAAKEAVSTAQSEAKWSDYFAYNDRTEETDYASLSKYQTTANGKEAKRSGADSFYETGFDNIIYDYINRNPDAVKIQRARNLTEDLSYLEEMTDEEIGIYNYVYAKEGVQAASEYLEHIRTDLTGRRREDLEKELAKQAKANPVAASLTSLAMTPVKGLSFLGQTGQMLTQGKIDENVGYNAASYVSSAIRDAVSKTAEEKWGKAGSFLYQTGMSMGDFLLSGSMAAGSPGLALAIMGTGAAADTTIAAKDRGLSDKQAYTLGAVAGLAEVVTEKISVDALLDKTSLGKSAMGYILKNMAAEGSEEVGSDLINLAADVLISKDRSQWQQSIEGYVQQGMSREQAFAKAVADQAASTVSSALGGALSGGVMGAGSVVLNRGKSPEAPGVQMPEGEQEAPAAAPNAATPTPEASFDASLLRQTRDQIIATMSTQLRTVENDRYLRRLSGAETDLQISGVLAGAEDAQIESAQRLSDLLGKRILFEPADKSKNGWYKRSEDIIYLNPKTETLIAQVIGHELTHSIEVSTEDYGALQRMVQERIQKTGGDLDAMRQQKIDLYAQNDVTISQAQADREIVAEYIEKNLLTDEQAIGEMVRDNRSLARRILDWLDGLLAKFGNKNAQERQFVLQAREKYRSALEHSYGIHERNQMQQARMQAYAEGDDAAGDALMDAQWEEPGYVNQPLEDDSSDVQFSFAGENAENADLAALRQAKQMEAQGVDTETIRKNTGWFRGMEGKWRWEIDDSGMQYYRSGDALFSQMHPEYVRQQELERKFLYGEITPEEDNELRQLQDVWGSENQRLRDRVTRGNAQLGNMIQHEKLFESYPWLRGVKVRFADLPEGTRGQWNRENNTITLSNEIRSNPEGTLLHEIQHAIQDHEGFSGGASTEYWGGQMVTKPEYAREVLEAKESVKQAEDAFRREWGDTINLNLAKRYIELDNQLWESESDPAKQQELADQMDQIEQAARESGWGDLFDDYYYAVGQLQLAKERAKLNRRTSIDLYRSTAGEIEARDSTGRRGLDSAGRKNTPPNLGDENTVFVEGDSPTARSESIVDQMRSALPEIMEMESVATIDAENATTYEGVHKLDEKAGLAEFRSQGGRAYRKGFGKVLLSRKGVVDTVFHGNGPAKQASFPAIKAVIENGVEIGRDYNHKEKGFDTVTFAAPIDFFGEKVLLGVVVKVYRNGRGDSTFYIHEICDSEGNYVRMELSDEIKKEISNTGGLDSSSSAGIADSEVPLKNSVPDFGGDVKQYSISEEAGEEAPDPVAALPWKAQQNLKGIERKLLNGVAKSLNVPYQGKRDFLQPIIQEISREYLRSGIVSQETADRLFETAYEQGRVVDEEFYNQYRHVKDYLRTQAVTLSERDREDIADFDDFRNRARYTLKIKNEGGLPVDTAWGELQEMAPELFPNDITHPADQLQKMLDVGQSIKKAEYTLERYCADDAEGFKAWAKNDFDAAISDAVAQLRQVKRFGEDRLKKEQAAIHSDLTQEEVTALYPQLKEARRAYEKAVAKNLLTEEDQKQVGRLLRGDIELAHLNLERDNVKGITAVYEAKLEYEKYAKQIRQWNRSRKARLMAEAAEYTESANAWKDKRVGILYSRETMERNIRDIVPDKDLAERIIDTYIKPVHDGAALANRTKNKYRDRIRALNLSRKAESEHVSEAYAVQLLGEAEDNIRFLEKSRGRIKHRDGKTIDEWRSVIQDLWTENPQLDQAKIRGAVEEFRKIYDELFTQMNEARIRNGYEPVNYRQGYFPHFQAKDEEGVMVLFGKALGIKTEVTALPTSINGLTHTFKPGIRWMGNALERKGFETAYDALEGFDRYIEGVADVIHQTDNIQRLRALEAQARYRTTDEGIRQQIDAVRAREDLSDIDKENRVKEIYESARYALSNFVVELEEYTNLLANKKSRADRNMERAMGRDMYNLVKSLESRVAANMVAINPGSWLTNFIPLTQGAATLDSGLIWQGMLDTLKAIKNDDGFVDSSSFLINRRGSDPLVQTWQQKASATMSKPMELIDSFTADSLVRARFKQNVSRGMSDAAAMEEADQWAAGVMADRSKGSTPTLFNRSNPLTKLFTQFQLEVNNQLSYVFKDIPREAGERDKYLAALALMLFKFAIGAFFYNEAYEYVIGRRPALDPLGILNDTVGDITGFELPNMVEYITGENRSIRTEKVGGHVAAGNLATNVLEELPFVGSLMGGGRLPISSALPDWENLAKAAFNEEWSPEKRLATAASELGNPLTYLALPFGGGQIKKIWQGAKAVIEGGSYTVDSEGNELLQYPVYSDNPLEWAMNAGRAILFGKSSLPTGADWIESGFKNLSATATAAYQDLMGVGVSGRDAYELVRDISGAKKTSTKTVDAVRRDILRESEVSSEGKAIVYYALMANDNERSVMDALSDSGTDMESLVESLMDIRTVKTTGEKLSVLIDSGLDDEAHEEIAGYIMGKELTTDKGNTTKYADYLESVERGLEPDEALQMQRDGIELEDFLKYTDAGLSTELAADLAWELHEMAPEAGNERVTELQKWKAACGVSDDVSDQMAALEAVMEESAFKKLSIGYEYGVDPAAYVHLKEILPQFDANGSGSYSHDEITEAINSMSASGLVMSGGDGTLFYLTNAQKAALWQLWSTSTSAKNNPYDTDIGWAVIEAKKAE